MSKALKILLGVVGVFAVIGGLMFAYDIKTERDFNKMFE